MFAMSLPVFVVFRNRAQHSARTFLCHAVHIWRFCIFKGGPATEFREWIICHTISENDDIFHKNPSPFFKHRPDGNPARFPVNQPEVSSAAS